MEQLKNFEDLQCWKISVELCEFVYNTCEKSKLPADDELACRRYVSALNVSWKIAFAYGPEDVEWLKKYLPLAKKYCMETVFWTWLAVQKWHCTKADQEKIIRYTKRIIKKLDSILRYLNKYSGQEKYRWNVFFKKSWE